MAPAPGEVFLFFVPLEDVKDSMKLDLNLAPDQVAVLGVEDGLQGELELGNLHYKILSFQEKPEFFKLTLDYLMKTYVVLLPSGQELEKVAEESTLLEQGRRGSRFFYAFDLAGDNAKAQGHEELSRNLLAAVETGDGFRLQAKEVDRKDYRMIYGGIFFTGIFLGLVFILAAMLSIYYKQLTEGYEDRKRFEIMEKVGMTDREVKDSIRRQILIVFFLPLIMAGVHMAFAFNAVNKILVMLNLTNRWLHIYSVVGVFFAFTLLYTLVYLWTSKTYYGIVTMKK